MYNFSRMEAKEKESIWGKRMKEETDSDKEWR